MAGKKSDEKIDEAKEVFIKSLIMRCKTEDNEDLFQVPEMVGFYNEAALPATMVQTADDVRQSIKKVVCSPDLPITEYPPNQLLELSSVKCQFCHKIYTSKAALQAHLRTHSKETDDPYRCNICSKTFAVPARLTRHYRTHTGEKPFRCEFCNKSFSVKENLSVHRRIHTKERPYKCEVCSRAFEHSGKLHRHMRIHTGERPHRCSVCSKTFIQSGQLVIHMRTHTGEKPYVCTVCQKGFTCSKQLKVHSRTHTGEKPYSCEICGKSFGYNHVLKLHQVAHYGEKVYKCTICNDTFNSKKNMEAHIKSHSDNNPPPIQTPPVSSGTSESSCSSISDKENKHSPSHRLQETPISYDSDIRYYIQTQTSEQSSSYSPQTYLIPAPNVEIFGSSPDREREMKFSKSEVVFDIIKHPQEIFAAAALRHPAYFSSSPIQCSSLNAADDIRKKVEAALAVEEMPSEEEPILTPPSSNPVSPVPSVSPPVSPDPELSLPPRKRSRMIAKSMEDASPVRYSSVIQYAHAS